MRALGPGSVSSFLKLVLDVAYAAMLAGVAAALLMLLAAILFAFNPGLLANVHLPEAERFTDQAPLVVGGLVVVGAYMTGVLIILGALRRIFSTLTAGDPFRPQNVSRLRAIGLALAALELERYAVWGVSAWLPAVDDIRPGFSLTGWFSVLVVFVLAEVFREGARLRREAELTI
jgi:hypothetical protein